MFGIDDGGCVTFASEEFAELFEIAPSTLRGVHISTLVAGDVADLLRAVETVKTTDGRTSRRCRVTLDCDTEHLPVMVEVTAGADDTVTCAIHRAGEFQDRFNHLFELLDDPAVAFEMRDLVPVVRAVNPAFAETFGYEQADIVGESLNDYIVPDGRVREATDYDERTADGKTNHAIVSRKTTDGRREFDYHSLPYEAEDGRRYGFAIYTDVTEDRRRRRRLQVLHRVLRHNLRNELSIINGTAEYVITNATEPDIQTKTRAILEAGQRLGEISEQSRAVESALDNVSEQAVDAVELARTVSGEYREQIAVDAPHRSIGVVGGGALTDALDNLLENAIEHTPPETSVTVTVGSDSTDAFIRVTDDGPGIPEVERAAVFEDQPITTLQHGSGLGLWLSRWVAEAAGGDLRYDRIDGDTRVTLRIPLAEDDDLIEFRPDEPVTEPAADR